MKVVLVSMDQVWENKEQNLTECEKHIERACREKADLIIFPEMTLTGFSTNIEKTAENEEDSKTIETFKKFSKEHNIAILFGVVLRNGDKAKNMAVFIDGEGKELGRYAKIHPFSFAGEDRFFSSGNALTTVRYQDLKIGLSICYDLRFPELYTALACQCDMIVNIANWPATRVDHWLTLLKARAIENQIFVAGVNRTGKDGNGLEYVESSAIYNADGKRLPGLQNGPMQIVGVQKKWTENFRKKFLTIEDRKPELYKEWLEC